MRGLSCLLGAVVLLLLAQQPFAQMPASDATGGAVSRVPDPLLENQWHLKARNLEVAGANVRSVWPTTQGAGVLVGIVDDGLQGSHPDLQANFNAGASFDFNFGDTDPTPLPEHPHGTESAGVAAARDDNGIGVAGVAPRASLAGLRLIAAANSDADEANAFGHLPQAIHILSNSWGPPDNGATLEGPGPLATAAMESAVASGRSGKGRIFVWAGGNGRQNQDNCNFDGYANSRFAIAVGAITDTGQQAAYSESCAALIVSAPSSGGTRAITTTDLTGTVGADPGDYTATFGGTSAAAPAVAGAVALMLARNPNLTWRDVQHVLRRSSHRLNPEDSEWTAGPYPHNEKYGFGQLDAQAAVNLAATWVNVPAETMLSPVTRTLNVPVPDDDVAGVSDAISISAGSNFVVEHVEVQFTAAHTWRGDLQVMLTSPAGVVSTLAPIRLADSGDDFPAWRFSTVRHWGESPTGQWTLRVADLLADFSGTWNSWTLRVYGYASSTQFTDDPLIPGVTQVKALHISELRTRIDGVRVKCGLPPYPWSTNPIPAVVIQAAHITELRGAVSAAHTACGGPAPTFFDPVLVPRGTPIKAVHITELRNAVAALE